MKHKHDMKHKFEEYFPLPWETTKEKDVVFIKGQGWNIPVIIAEGSAAECAEREALRYAVQCANLMPEAARLLNEALRIIEKACIACANIDAYHCGLCGREETTREIKALLAKLEGGADNAPNP